MLKWSWIGLINHKRHLLQGSCGGKEMVVVIQNRENQRMLFLTSLQVVWSYRYIFPPRLLWWFIVHISGIHLMQPTMLTGWESVQIIRIFSKVEVLLVHNSKWRVEMSLHRKDLEKSHDGLLNWQRMRKREQGTPLSRHSLERVSHTKDPLSLGLRGRIVR